MITITRLNVEDMKKFHGKSVIIHGYSSVAKDLCRVFQYLDIPVVAFCGEGFQYKLHLYYRGIPVVQTSEIGRFVKGNRSIVIQSMEYEKRKIEALREKAEKVGIELSAFHTGQIMTSFAPMVFIERYYEASDYKKDGRAWRRTCKQKVDNKLIRFLLHKSDTDVTVCLPTKVGDHTINDTFEAINESLSNSGGGIRYRNIFHKPRRINRKLCEKRFGTCKIITGVREPISQNLSIAYQELACGEAYKDWILGGLEGQDEVEQVRRLRRYESLFGRNGNDVQMFFHAFVDRYVYGDKGDRIQTFHARSIQEFMKDFQEYGVDIMKYPFDKEKGYTIIREGNTEVFVYQIEKLNQAIPALSEWIGVPFQELVTSNQASDKWIAQSYKQAQREIRFTHEYFDRCFGEPYVRHCYSEDDIEKFKDKWRSHII